jgi:hypothetical protein
MSCKHQNWARIVGGNARGSGVGNLSEHEKEVIRVRWCSMCGSIFHKVKLKNGKWSKRSRWIKPKSLIYRRDT